MIQCREEGEEPLVKQRKVIIGDFQAARETVQRSVLEDVFGSDIEDVLSAYNSIANRVDVVGVLSGEADEREMSDYEIDLDEWATDAIMFSSGLSSIKYEFAKDKLYACDGKVKDASRYCIDDEDSLTMPEFAREQIEFPTLTVGGIDRIRSIPAFCKVSSADPLGVMKEVKEFCRAYPGFAVRTGGPGAQEEQVKLASFRAYGVRGPYLSNRQLDCIPATFFNGKRCLRGMKDDEIVK